MFVDTAKIYVKAGNGGNGCTSFYKDKYSRYPRRDGGCGGIGGNIVIKSSENLLTLLDFKYRQHFKADKGKNGSSQKKRGQNGKDKIILVPVGTIIRDFSTGLLIRDIAKKDEEVIVAKGGKGGRGNSVLKVAEPGQEGEEKEVSLELKLLADIGIIGYPNIGKSSLINCISNSKSKIANYPFTTKSPLLGVVRFDDRHQITIADIPGIIEDAHSGKGLGFKFLKHIERTNLLLHMIDMSTLSGRDPIGDFSSLNEELALYDKLLLKKKQILVANKMDLEGASENLARFRKKIKRDIFPISCKTKEGIDKLLKVIFSTLNKEDNS